MSFYEWLIFAASPDVEFRVRNLPQSWRQNMGKLQYWQYAWTGRDLSSPVIIVIVPWL